ncbi:K(+)/H(+) antiporter NhaP [Pirellula sp. SH-Sr6A]|uniref:potassium/proton antiporter n=1 Tax=Pirellula sp. SH-Sr6A TaxID=1632865 RepID=UPI00078BC11D|nr:potassium/proton antiporter [Pirellula sp. SH-Sr6A]AMV34822.1 K(+)/H(+) antiporter NhaP [Pirellula sp. SH-Sr6A]
MANIDSAILVGSFLLLLGVLSSKFSSRFGMPALVTFLGLGMLAGSDGIGGIAFDDYGLAYSIGTVVLAIILYSGGLSTPLESVRSCWKPAGILATLGVVITAVVTGLAASWLMGLSLSHGLLLGSIVGSTDASAVFSILRAGGIHLRRRLADTLEVESGSNDPMAIFMTICMLQYLTGGLNSWQSLVFLLLRQILVGLVVGISAGYLAVWALRTVHLQVAGLYPIFAVAFGLMSYGGAATLGGSGFLAIYLTGIIVGNYRTPFSRGTLAFHDGLAWLGQIVMFILLGLLCFPSQFVDVIGAGVAISVVLALVSRPLAVFLCLIWSQYNLREKLLLSWVGLKGAVPITLAIFPLMAGVEGASKIFDVVFFVVLVSAVVQGSSLSWVANKLKLDIKPKEEPPITLEISSVYEVDADIVDYFIEPDTLAAGKLIRDLALPYEVVIALIVREGKSKLPKGSSRIAAGDHIIVVVHRNVRQAVDHVFARSRSQAKLESWPEQVEFPIRGIVKLADLEESYGLKLESDPQSTLSQWLRQQVPEREISDGTIIECGSVTFTVRSMDGKGNATLIGMRFGNGPNLTDGKPTLQEQPDAPELGDASKSV